MVKRTNEEWQKLLAQQKGSGQPVKRWCKENGHPYDTYKYWYKKICGMVSGGETAATTFVEIAPLPELTPEEKGNEYPFRVHWQGYRIEISQSAEVTKLSEIIAALPQSC